MTKQKIEEAWKTFVPTKIFNDIKTKLKNQGHITLLGASGEGKTTMSLMLARKYEKKGFQVVFVESIDEFDMTEYIKQVQVPKLFLIFDDIFGDVGISSNARYLRKKFKLVSTYLKQCKERSNESQNLSNRTQKAQTEANQGWIPELHVVFSSNTLNFPKGLPDSLFSVETVVDLSNTECYTNKEKHSIFEVYRKSYKRQEQIFEHVNDISFKSLGFPMKCKLFFSIQDFREYGKDFFQKPLEYLKNYLDDLLKNNNEKAAALALMILCNKLDMRELESMESNQTMNDRFELLLNIFPNVTREMVVKTSKNFIGTFFFGENVLRFAHSFIHDSFVWALYNFSPSFVLNHCQDDFLFGKLKVWTHEETGELRNISSSDEYDDLVASRLFAAMREGKFKISVTHPILEKETVVRLLFQRLQAESNVHITSQWIHRKDKDRGFLYWAVHGCIFVQISDIVNEFTESEICEALDAVVEEDNLELLELLFLRIPNTLYPQIISELLLLSDEIESQQIKSHLLQKAADVNTTDDIQRNIVHLACDSGNVKFLTFFMESKAWENQSSPSIFDSPDTDGRTPAMLAALFRYQTCFDLVIGHTKETQKNDIYGNSLVHFACYVGNKNILEKLILATDFDIDNRGKDDLTPVMVAVLNGHWGIFSYLSDNNADLTLADVHGDSVLHLACQEGNKAIVENLVGKSGVQINRLGRYRWTPVMKAAVHGHLSVFEFLKSKGADLTLTSDSNDKILHLACQGGNTAIVRQLVTPDTINCTGEHGRTPIMKAAMHGHRTVFDFLVDKKAALTLVHADRNSLLHLACQGGNTAIVRQLLTPDTIDCTGEHGRTPIMKAAMHGHRTVFDFLVDQKASLTLVDADRNSLLHLACQGGNTAIVQQLMPDFDINIKGWHKMTPAMMAANRGHKEVLDILIKSRANLQLTDKNGDDICKIAEKAGHSHLEKLLKPYL